MSSKRQPTAVRATRFAPAYGLLAVLWLATMALIAPTVVPAAPGAPSGDGVQPVEVGGNPVCSEFGLYELKVDPPTGGEHSDGLLTVDLKFTGSPDGELLDWTSNIGVDLVIVKGGNAANLYEYSEAEGDTDLHSPTNSSGKYADVSHATFCYDIELEVEKTAETTFTRDYEWYIEKSNDAPGPIMLSPGQTFGVGYEVTVGVLGHQDSGWAVQGQITVHNPAPDPAEGVQVSDLMTGGIVPAVDCNGEEPEDGLPATIPAESSLICTYASPLPNGDARTNEASATSTTPGIGAGSGTAPVEFGPPSELIDECVTVSDDNLEPPLLGEVCVGEAPHTFEYTKSFGPFPNECVTYEFDNTASFVTNDNQETGEATSSIEIEVKCENEGGCTLTQGYWKTHSEYGPAPSDDTWALLPPAGPDSPLFDSAKTWYEAFWTPPRKGNAYWILAHQYMAAVLNQLNGANTPTEVSEAIGAAEAFLEDFGEYDGAKGKARKEMIELAGILAAYNEGQVGPGHCSEDGSSAHDA